MTTLLPVNAGLFERALEASFAPAIDIDVDALRRMRDPWAASTAHLPFLAWGRGVDLWYDDWPEWKKRRITAEIYTLKGLKGTLAGHRRYLGYVDAAIEAFVIPPQGVVARRYDPVRLSAWRDRFAELRLYPFAIRGTRPACVPAVAGRATIAIPGRIFARPNAGAVHYGRRAVLRDRGVETVLRSFDQIAIGGSDVAIPVNSFAITAQGRPGDALPGRAVVGRAVAGRVRGRLIVIGAGTIGGMAVPAGFEGIDLLDVSPQRVLQRHDGLSSTPIAAHRPRSACGSLIARRADAGQHVFDRWFVMDRDRAGGTPFQALGPVVGKMVPGLGRFTALLRIDARFSQPGRSAVTGRSVPGRAVARMPNDRIDRVGAALFQSRAVRDRVLFTTKTHRPRSIADLSFAAPQAFGTGMVPIQRRPQ